MAYEELTEEQLRALYAWIDAIPLSRPKRNISRDFSDGVLLAEVIHAYFPHMVELHNYTPANSVKQKVYNLETLNQRTLRKLGYIIDRDLIDGIVNYRQGAIESVLNTLQFKMAKYRERKASSDRGSAASPADDLNSYQPKSMYRAKEQSSSSLQTNRRHGTVPQKQSVLQSVDEEILLEKEQQIRELQETVEILELKIAKLEQLVRLKDNKIQKLLQR